MARNWPTKPSRQAVIHGYRSDLEIDIANQIEAEGIMVEYETTKINYQKPATNHKYTPDFLLPNGIFVEVKGRFVAADRKKHLLIKKQHPELDIRFVFSRSKQKIRKGAKSSYADWCDKHGFKYADKFIPAAWFAEEVPND